MWKLVLASILISQVAIADTYKCKSPSGQVMILDSPCPTKTNTEAVRRDEIVTPEQQRQAARNVDSMRSDLSSIQRKNCLDSARLANTKGARDRLEAECLGKPYRDDDGLPSGQGARIKNCNQWGCYDTSGNYIPRN